MRIWRLIVAMLALAAAIPARAGVVITFWSHDMDKNYPHAFITTEGTTDDGKRVSANFGFTAKSISPAILLGSVAGEIETVSSGYLKRSQRRFSVAVSQRQYDAVMALITRWKRQDSRNYDLNSHNCIHFVGQVAKTLGLRVSYDSGLLMKPRDFVLRILSLNPVLKPAG